jgi:DNA (cytosine-5)-methyltransferase 1
MLKKIDYLPFLEACWQEHLQPKADNAPTVISLFAGGGGSSLGYSMAGFRELLAVEWDDNAVETFRLNFPDVPVYHGDIAKLTVEQVLEMTGLQPGQLDVLDGSPPCQGFSTAGKRQLDDPRNSLFREYVRLLRGLQPKVFVMENVSGMVKGIMKLVFAEIMRELKASGYKVSARLLNAMYFGVPQSRERIIFIGVRNDLNAIPIHPVAETRPIAFGDAILEKSGTEIMPRIAPNHSYVKRIQTLKPGQSIGKVYGQGFNWIRCDDTRPLPTISKSTTYGKLGFLFLSDGSRNLSSRELARCHSYSDRFDFAGDYVDITARIGNSVPPLFMRSIALHIRQEILERIIS